MHLIYGSEVDQFKSGTVQISIYWEKREILLWVNIVSGFIVWINTKNSMYLQIGEIRVTQ